MIADVYNTTVNFDGSTMYSASYIPFSGYCGGMYPMNSCFGYGFGYGCDNMLGATIGCAVGWSASKFVPQAFNAVAKGVSNLWNNIFHKKPKTEQS